VVTYRFGPYRLLPHERRLERDGSPIALTPKAFDLLVALVTHRERALSKDEIMSLVWPGSIVEEANLAQQVLLLRRALADSDDDCVATIPRFGYRFTSTVVEERTGGASPSTSAHCLVWDGREYPLHEGLTVIGRADDADVQIPLPSLSRHHARVSVRGLEATIEDLGSRHGSWRGTQPVKTPTPLASGDEIRLGTATLVYCLVLPDNTTLA
jgi:DNA-binding winged helix-turn-helix (wHTH) protein